MKELVFGVLGALLVVAPGWMLFNTMVPVPEYRTGTFADYSGAVRACLTLYGGAMFGSLVLWMRRTQQPQPTSLRDVFRASFFGAMAAIGLVILAAGGGGNLVGVVVIFGAVFSAIIAVGVALVWQAVARGKAA